MIERNKGRDRGGSGPETLVEAWVIFGVALDTLTACKHFAHVLRKVQYDMMELDINNIRRRSNDNFTRISQTIQAPKHRALG